MPSLLKDQYFKGALMLNTLRKVIDDFNQQSGMNLTLIFNQYLRHAQIPHLDLLFGEALEMVMYKWSAGEVDSLFRSAWTCPTTGRLSIRQFPGGNRSLQCRRK
jgi:hypothetical protein